MSRQKKYTEAFLLRLTPSQKERADRAAEKKGLERTAYIRMLIEENAPKEETE